jgi:hypothetical protein
VRAENLIITHAATHRRLTVSAALTCVVLAMQPAGMHDIQSPCLHCIWVP